MNEQTKVKLDIVLFFFLCNGSCMNCRHFHFKPVVNKGERTDNNQLGCILLMRKILFHACTLINGNDECKSFWWERERDFFFLTCGWQGQGEGFPWKVGRRTCRDIERKGKPLHLSRQGNHFHTWYTRTLQWWPKKWVVPTTGTTWKAVAHGK